MFVNDFYSVELNHSETHTVYTHTFTLYTTYPFCTLVNSNKLKHNCRLTNTMQSYEHLVIIIII